LELRLGPVPNQAVDLLLQVATLAFRKLVITIDFVQQVAEVFDGPAAASFHEGFVLTYTCHCSPLLSRAATQGEHRVALQHHKRQNVPYVSAHTFCAYDLGLTERGAGSAGASSSLDLGNLAWREGREPPGRGWVS